MGAYAAVGPSVAFPRGFKLPGRSLIRTACLDELGEILAREAEPKSLTFVERATRAPSELTLLALPRTRFYGVSHGSAVCCLTTQLDCFEFIFVINGTLLSGTPGQQRRVTAGEAILHLPGGSHCARWEPNSKAVFLRIEPRVLSPFAFGPQRFASDGRDGRVRVLSLGSGLGRTLFSMCEQICDEAEGSCTVEEQVRQEDLLLYAAGWILQRLADPEAAASGGRPLPPYLKTTVEYIYANLDRKLDVRTLASVPGMSVRTLQQAFAHHFRMGPLVFMRHARLQRVREELLHANPWETTVTDVAVRWGFTHLSNFSRDYRNMFGESPSRTLRTSCCSAPEPRLDQATPGRA